jgi:hypothetical protein
VWGIFKVPIRLSLMVITSLLATSSVLHAQGGPPQGGPQNGWQVVFTGNWTMAGTSGGAITTNPFNKPIGGPSRTAEITAKLVWGNPNTNPTKPPVAIRYDGSVNGQARSPGASFSANNGLGAPTNVLGV